MRDYRTRPVVRVGGKQHGRASGRREGQVADPWARKKIERKKNKSKKNIPRICYYAVSFCRI
jgi:hypothetical protein